MQARADRPAGRQAPPSIERGKESVSRLGVSIMPQPIPARGSAAKRHGGCMILSLSSLLQFSWASLLVEEVVEEVERRESWK